MFQNDTENLPKFKNRMEKCRYFKKKEEEKWKSYLEKDRVRNKENRQKKKEIMTESDKIKKKEQTRSRVKAWRAKQKLAKLITETPVGTPTKLGSYKKKNTLRKAVSKVKKALPFSPKKKRAVIRQLLTDDFGTNDDLFVSKTTIIRKKFCEETKDKVIQWYESDEVSWQAPGKRDYIKVFDKELKKKIQKQKRFLMMTIDEARALFLEKNPNISVSRSKFFELRPKHVIPVANTPHNVCVCVKHANFSFLVEGLKAAGLESTFNHRILLNLMCCNTDSEGCMTNVCENCKTDVKTILNENTDYSVTVKWKSWRKEDGKYQVMENSTTLQDVLNKINETLPAFKFHCFVKKVQSEHFDHMKNNIDKGSAVIQIDYAENFALTSQDEIQSAHWCHAQVTLFTACIWYEHGVKSYVVVSDDMSHSKECSWVFLKAVVDDFKQFEYEELTTLSVFSDNCSAQFKSKYTVSNVCYLASDLNLTDVQWSSFAAGHGKGAVDAIGGQLKRNIWIRVKSRSVILNTPQDFFNASQTYCNLVTTLFVSKEDVDETGEKLLKKRWEQSVEVIGIRKYHHFQKIDDDHVLAAVTCRSPMQKHQVINAGKSKQTKTRVRYCDVYSTDSEDDCSSIGELEKRQEDESEVVETLIEQDELVEESQIIPDKYVLVKYHTHRLNNLFYAAVCQSAVTNDGEVSVLFLTSHGKNRRVFKVGEEGEKYIDVEQVVKILPTPKIIAAGNRLYYEFTRPLPVS